MANVIARWWRLCQKVPIILGETVYIDVDIGTVDNTIIDGINDATIGSNI